MTSFDMPRLLIAGFFFCYNNGDHNKDLFSLNTLALKSGGFFCRVKIVVGF